MKKIWVTKLILAVMLCGSFGGANAAGSFCTEKVTKINKTEKGDRFIFLVFSRLR